MKKILILLSIAFALMAGCNAFASEDIKIIIDGEQKYFSPGPIIQNESTIVPMRAIFESLGANVYWYDETRSVVATRNNTTVKLTIGSIEAYVNNNLKYLSAKPQIIQERTYVPLRFISEALGANISWDGINKTITINDVTKEQLIKPTLVDTQNYEIKMQYDFTNEGDRVDATFVTAIGAYSNSSYQMDSTINVTPTPYEIYSDDYGNKYAKIKIANILKGQQASITITKKLVNSGIEYNIDEDTVSQDYKGVDDYYSLISPQPQIESDNPLIIEKAKQLSYGEANPYKIAQNIYEYVNLSMTYDTNEAYARKGALSALTTHRGVCEDYSKLFVALLRAEGIPARSIFGFWLDSDTINKIGYDSWYDVEVLAHEWPEFYLPGYGWIIAEPTFEYTYNGQKAVPWSQFANQERNGHIVFAYNPSSDQAIMWNISGYGSLNLALRNSSVQIRKGR